jgi:hypothetical protein
MTSETLDWAQQSGFRVNQTWHGPSGPGKATRSAWLAEWRSIYGLEISLQFRDLLPVEDGDADCEAQIGYASTEQGEPLPDTDPNYGLIERSWTLGGTDQQLSIRENPRVEELAQFWREWPAMIRNWVFIYNEAQSGGLKVWNEAGQVGDPILPKWKVPVPPPPPIGPPTAPDTGLLNNAAILADRLLTDIQATWQTTGYQLRKTERVTSWSTLVVSHLDVNRLLSWNALIVHEPTLPGTGLIQTAGLEALIWLKAAPEVTATSGGNYELSHTYTSFVRPPAGSKREKDLIFDYGEIVESIP